MEDEGAPGLNHVEVLDSSSANYFGDPRNYKSATEENGCWFLRSLSSGLSCTKSWRIFCLCIVLKDLCFSGARDSFSSNVKLFFSLTFPFSSFWNDDSR